MVKHALDVYDLFRPQSLNCAQGKIVILRAAEQVAKTADFAEQVPAIKAEMVNEILHQKKLGIPVAFEVRLGPRAGVINLVFVRINETGIGMAHDRCCGERERVLGQKIILVEQRNPLAGSEGQGRIRARRDVAIFSTKDNLNSRIASGGVSQERRDARIR